MELNYNVIRNEIANSWGQGSGSNIPEATMVCLLGAANKSDNWEAAKQGLVCYDNEVAYTLARELVPVINEMFPDRVPSYLLDNEDLVQVIYTFNDYIDTTQEDVLAVIDEVIRRKQQNVYVPEQRFELVDSEVSV